MRIWHKPINLIFLSLIMLLTAALAIADALGDAHDLQERCGRLGQQWSKKLFPNAYGGRATYLMGRVQHQTSYQSHYNTRLNHCLILVQSLSFIPNVKSSAALQAELISLDVDEGLSYASYFEQVEQREIAQCVVEGRTCSSKGQWDAMVKPYMEQ